MTWVIMMGGGRRMGSPAASGFLLCDGYYREVYLLSYRCARNSAMERN